jgi:predicted thioesterase
MEAVVDDTMTAAAVGSGLVKGLSTPSMIALMEGASVAAISALLPPQLSSVGTHLEVKHMAPTPVGMRVRASATLREVDRRRLVFEVTVEDEIGEVGRGRHERFIVDLASFEEKLRARGPGLEGASAG